MAMNSEQTTEEGSVELTLENYEELLSNKLNSDVRPRSTEINSQQTTEERLDYPNYKPGSLSSLLNNINSEQTTEERRMELDYPTYKATHFKLLGWLRKGPFRVYKMLTSYPDADGNIISLVLPDFVTPHGGSHAVPVEPNHGTTGVGEGTNADILQTIQILARIRAIQFSGAQVAAHVRRSTFGAGSSYISETMSAEASPRGGDGPGVEWNDDMLPVLLRSSARAIREYSGSQDFLVDEAGGRFLAIHIHPPQQRDRDQGLVGAAPGTQDGPGDLARQALPSVIGGFVPLCFNLLLDDNILKAGGSPGYIKAAAYAGLGLVTVFTFLGLASKKRAKAAARVVASASTAAVSIAVVYRVSDNAYIQCFCGIMGCVATLATMAIDW